MDAADQHPQQPCWVSEDRWCSTTPVLLVMGDGRSPHWSLDSHGVAKEKSALQRCERLYHYCVNPSPDFPHMPAGCFRVAVLISLPWCVQGKLPYDKDTNHISHGAWPPLLPRCTLVPTPLTR